MLYVISIFCIIGCCNNGVTVNSKLFKIFCSLRVRKLWISTKCMTGKLLSTNRKKPRFLIVTNIFTKSKNLINSRKTWPSNFMKHQSNSERQQLQIIIQQLCTDQLYE